MWRFQLWYWPLILVETMEIVCKSTTIVDYRLVYIYNISQNRFQTLILFHFIKIINFTLKNFFFFKSTQQFVN
jgi:hypothetical protein